MEGVQNMYILVLFKGMRIYIWSGFSQSWDRESFPNKELSSLGVLLCVKTAVTLDEKQVQLCSLGKLDYRDSVTMALLINNLITIALAIGLSVFLGYIG